MTIEYKNLCTKCGDHVLYVRWRNGLTTCVACGAKDVAEMKALMKLTLLELQEAMAKIDAEIESEATK